MQSRASNFVEEIYSSPYFFIHSNSIEHTLGSRHFSRLWGHSGECIYICISWASQVALVEGNLPVNAGDIRDVVWEDPLEKAMAAHSSIPAWRIPRTEEPSGLLSMGLERV